MTFGIFCSLCIFTQFCTHATNDFVLLYSMIVASSFSSSFSSSERDLYVYSGIILFGVSFSSLCDVKLSPLQLM